MKSELAKFDVARISLSDTAPVTTPEGRSLPADQWARGLQIVYTPSIVFFDGPAEVFRIEAYVRPFHLAGSLAYVSSRAYLKEPSFQRYLQARGESMRRGGRAVDLWK